MNDRSNEQGPSGVFIGLGVLLIVLGSLFFAGQAIGFDVGRFGWPFFVIIPGLAVSGVGLAVSDPSGERITPLGAALTMAGVIRPAPRRTPSSRSGQRCSGRAFPTSIGLGRMIYGSLKERKDLIASGGRLALIGATLFVVGAFFFELVVGISGFGLGRLGWPLGW
jgi:hypothetical protein